MHSRTEVRASSIAKHRQGMSGTDGFNRGSEALGWEPVSWGRLSWGPLSWGPLRRCSGAMCRPGGTAVSRAVLLIVALGQVSTASGLGRSSQLRRYASADAAEQCFQAGGLHVRLGQECPCWAMGRAPAACLLQLPGSPYVCLSALALTVHQCDQSQAVVHPLQLKVCAHVPGRPFVCRSASVLALQKLRARLQHLHWCLPSAAQAWTQQLPR